MAFCTASCRSSSTGILPGANGLQKSGSYPVAESAAQLAEDGKKVDSWKRKKSYILRKSCQGESTSGAPLRDNQMQFSAQGVQDACAPAVSVRQGGNREHRAKKPPAFSTGIPNAGGLSLLNFLVHNLHASIISALSFLTQQTPVLLWLKKRSTCRSCHTSRLYHRSSIGRTLPCPPDRCR